jgi:hypothetical protein
MQECLAQSDNIYEVKANSLHRVLVDGTFVVGNRFEYTAVEPGFRVILPEGFQLRMIGEHMEIHEDINTANGAVLEANGLRVGNTYELVVSRTRVQDYLRGSECTVIDMITQAFDEDKLKEVKPQEKGREVKVGDGLLMTCDVATDVKVETAGDLEVLVDLTQAGISQPEIFLKQKDTDEVVTHLTRHYFPSTEILRYLDLQSGTFLFSISCEDRKVPFWVIFRSGLSLVDGEHRQVETYQSYESDSTV